MEGNFNSICSTWDLLNLYKNSEFSDVMQSVALFFLDFYHCVSEGLKAEWLSAIPKDVSKDIYYLPGIVVSSINQAATRMGTEMTFGSIPLTLRQTCTHLQGAIDVLKVGQSHVCDEHQIGTQTSHGTRPSISKELRTCHCGNMHVQHTLCDCPLSCTVRMQYGSPSGSHL